MARLSRPLAAALAALAASCTSSFETPPAPTVSAPAQPAIQAEQLVGRWGVGAYHRDTDRERTEKEARAQCGNPYVIVAGKDGGVMMHLADEKEPSELFLKAGPDGVTYLGPEGPPGTGQDREISRFDGKTFTTTWLDQEIAGRYGTSVYVRCSGPARPAAGKRT